MDGPVVSHDDDGDDDDDDYCGDNVACTRIGPSSSSSSSYLRSEWQRSILNLQAPAATAALPD